MLKLKKLESIYENSVSTQPLLLNDLLKSQAVMKLLRGIIGALYSFILILEAKTGRSTR